MASSVTRTGKLIYDETSEDWNRSFENAWTASGGHIQSVGFALGALRQLFTLPEFAPFWKLTYVADNEIAHSHLTLHDYGCACGDGTALLQAAFLGANVKGFDHSLVGVEMARKRWPGITFEVGDVKAPSEDATIIFTSHTIEHTSDAAACVNGLLKRCQVLVALVPMIVDAMHGGHEGAEATATWLKRCPPPAHKMSFNTLRYNPAEGVWLAEGSLMFVWQGELKP